MQVTPNAKCGIVKFCIKKLPACRVGKPAIMNRNALWIKLFRIYSGKSREGFVRWSLRTGLLKAYAQEANHNHKGTIAGRNVPENIRILKANHNGS